MDCSQTASLVAAQLAGEAAEYDGRALADHLAACPGCRAEADGLVRTWEILGTLPDVEMSAGLWQRIQARIPATRPAPGPHPWTVTAGTAALGLLVSVVASWLLPFEHAASLCGEALRRLVPAAPLADPAPFFAVGFLYGLLPLGLAALVAARRLIRAGPHPGLGAGLVFGILALPYVIIACGGLPATSVAALMVGIVAGALAGGQAGVWAGGKLLAPVPA